MSDAACLYRFLALQGVTLLQAERSHLRAYLRSLEGCASANTRARRAAGLTTFYAFTTAAGLTRSNPAAHLPRPRRQHHERSVPTVAQLAQVLDEPTASTEHALRGKVILELLYGAGLRASELATLRLEHVDWSQRMLRVMGKGQKERLCPVHGAALQALEEYLAKRGGDTTRGPALTCTRGQPMNRMSLYARVRKLGRRHGLHLTPHLLRHAYATHMLEAGARIQDLQLLLGHVRLATTGRYAHPSREYLMRVYQRCHPSAAVHSAGASCAGARCGPPHSRIAPRGKSTTAGQCPERRAARPPKPPRRPRKAR